MERIEKQKNAELDHRKFIDLMYPYFGLEQNPGYTKIVVKPMLFAGVLGASSTIYIKSTSSPEERRYTNWHESGHLLHYHSSPLFEFGLIEKIEDDDGNPLPKHILAEMTTDLGAFIYLDIVEVINQETVEKYGLGPEMNSWLSPEEIAALFRIAKTDKKLLETLAKGSNEQELVSLVRSYS